MADAWSREENEVVVSSYLALLEAFLTGAGMNKASSYRLISSQVGRSEDSIERKHQNVSAVMIALGQPWVRGLAPLHNYQKQLAEVVESQLDARPALQALCAAWTDRPSEARDVGSTTAELLSDPPEPNGAKPTPYPPLNAKRRTGRLTNWLERESRNRSLGTAGELFALSFEHKRLWEAGLKSLAERLEHVAVSKGDGLGYDIQSYEANGADRLIEVKTTRLGIETPFFASRNEVGVSGARAEEYVVYRLYSFDVQPRMYHLHGALAESCNLDPVSFEARPR